MENERLSNNIRRLRFDAGQMTQEALADKVGVTRQTIIAIEQGKYVPSLTLAMKVARVFDKTVEEVFQVIGNLISANVGGGGQGAGGLGGGEKKLP
jgi:putative transcriptional regulator